MATTPASLAASLVNRALLGEGWALAKLAEHAGRIFTLESGPLAASFAMTTFIEIAQRSIPGRVPDERDLMANGLGAVIGVLIAFVLTLPAALRRHRQRRATTTRPTRVPAG